MNKLSISIVAMLCVILNGCNAIDVDKTVDNQEIYGDNGLINCEEDTKLSTETTANVDNFEDNSDKIVDNTTTWVDNESESVDKYGDIPELVLEQASYFYYYYASECKLHDIDADLIYSEKKFRNAWNEEQKFTLEDYFVETGWFDRGEYYSLQFVPKECMFDMNTTNAYEWMARCIHGFMLAMEKYQNDELWDNTDSLIPQYHCHSLFAGWKKIPWYIEPHRTETDFLMICAAKGNPENRE